MIEASCHCGAVRLKIARAPTEVTDCNCSICRRYGVLWAYYPKGEVTLDPSDAATDVYMWNDRVLSLHRCTQCGCVSHWTLVDSARDRVGVNARLMDPEVLTQARVRRLDGADTRKYLDD